MTAPVPHSQPICERLRALQDHCSTSGQLGSENAYIFGEAAARINELENALRPFARFADIQNAVPPEVAISVGSMYAKDQLTMGHCYAARAVFQPSGEAER